MKPIRNLIFCPECHRSKMLFQSEKKALNCIRFNAEEIARSNPRGIAPKRVYYCIACGGWHLTSMSANPNSRTCSENVLSTYHDMCESLQRMNEANKLRKREARRNQQQELLLIA